MDSGEKQYLDILQRIRTYGVRQKNRTGIDTFFLPGQQIQCDMMDGYPLLTTKKMYTKAIFGELLGFIRGYTNASQFRLLDCKIWDDNANKNTTWLKNPNRKGEDDLGKIYGYQWRRFAENNFENNSSVHISGCTFGPKASK